MVNLCEWFPPMYLNIDSILVHAQLLTVFMTQMLENVILTTINILTTYVIIFHHLQYIFNKFELLYFYYLWLLLGGSTSIRAPSIRGQARGSI